MTILCTNQNPPHEGLVDAIGRHVRVARELSEVDHMLMRDPGELLVVIGADVDLGQAVDFAGGQRLRQQALGVVLVRHELEIEAFSLAMRAGIREVVAAEDLTGLAEACRRSRALSHSARQPLPAPGRPDGKVITVFASKGGCGKTTLATNLAITLHAGGARVCLVDLDLAFGDVAISLQLEPKRTLVDAVAMGDSMDATGVAGLLTRFRPGLECVLAPVEPGDAEKVPASLIEDLLAVLRGMFDFVVVDTPPQFNEHVLKALDCADQHVLLTTPDMPTLKNLRVTIDMLDLLSYPRAARSILLNRENPRVGITAEDVEHVLRSSVVARIPDSIEVTASVNRGVPIAAEQPEHGVSVAIRDFGKRCLAGSPSARAAAPRPRFLARSRSRGGRHETQ